LSAEHVSRIGFALLASTANHQSAIKTWHKWQTDNNRLHCGWQS
jgi:hypothetical protein